MKIEDKKLLVRLLYRYMDELMVEDSKNRKGSRAVSYGIGIKSQYEHARIIAQKLSAEIGKDIEVWGFE